MSRVRDFSRTFVIPLYQQHWNSSIGWFPASFLNMDKKVETYPDWALILAGNGAKKVGNWQCLGSWTFRELSALHYISTRTHLLPGFLPVSWTWIKKWRHTPIGPSSIVGNGAKKVGNWQCLGTGTFRELLAAQYIGTGTRLLPCFLPVSWTWIKEVETHPDYALLLGWNGAKKVKNWQCLGFGTFQEPFVPLYYCTVSCILPLCSACLLGNCLLFV